jgi:hypothetical protein
MFSLAECGIDPRSSSPTPHFQLAEKVLAPDAARDNIISNEYKNQDCRGSEDMLHDIRAETTCSMQLGRQNR